jgi:hypothetical protein
MMRINYLHSGGHDQYVLNRFTEMEYNARFRNLPTTFVTTNPPPSNTQSSSVNLSLLTNTNPSSYSTTSFVGVGGGGGPTTASASNNDPFSEFDVNLMDVRRMQPVNSVSYVPTDRASAAYAPESRRSKTHVSLNDTKTQNGKSLSNTCIVVVVVVLVVVVNVLFFMS